MKLIKLTVVLSLALALCGCLDDGGPQSRVYQGQCVVLDAANHVLKLDNPDPKLNGIESPEVTFDLAGAKLGLAPQPGDTIRVAYFAQGESLKAIKVMNVTKQDLRRK